MWSREGDMRCEGLDCRGDYGDVDGNGRLFFVLFLGGSVSLLSTSATQDKIYSRVRSMKCSNKETDVVHCYATAEVAWASFGFKQWLRSVAILIDRWTGKEAFNSGRRSFGAR